MQKENVIKKYEPIRKGGTHWIVQFEVEKIREKITDENG